MVCLDFEKNDRKTSGKVLEHFEVRGLEGFGERVQALVEVRVQNGRTQPVMRLGWYEGGKRVEG